MTAALTSYGTRVDGEYFAGRLAQGILAPVVLTTRRVLIERSRNWASLMLGDIASVTAIENGRRFIVKMTDGHEWKVGGRRGFWHTFGHKEETEQFRRKLGEVVRPS